MTTSNARHRVAPQVVREVFDDEVIIIDMKSGNYFSLNTSGARVWTLVEQGYNVEDSVNRICEEHADDTRETIAERVRALINRLLDEGLIEISEGAPPPATREPKESATKKGRFEKPELAVFSDMQELLLLDPIHDVDETGWPQQRPDGVTG
jgi:hypothetical protein